jgi:hypothetical protein
MEFLNQSPETIFSQFREFLSKYSGKELLQIVFAAGHSEARELIELLTAENVDDITERILLCSFQSLENLQKNCKASNLSVRVTHGILVWIYILWMKYVYTRILNSYPAPKQVSNEEYVAMIKQTLEDIRPLLGEDKRFVVGPELAFLLDTTLTRPKYISDLLNHPR